MQMLADHGHGTVEVVPTLPHRDGSLRAQLDVALGEEIARFELRIAEVWQATGALGIALALFLGLRGMGDGLALWGTLSVAAYLVWFTVVAWRLRRGRGTSALRVATSIVESSLPWVFLGVLTRTQGAPYALGSWVPPLLFAGMIIVSTARLRPIEPLVLGLSGGLAFIVFYFVWLRSALPPEFAGLPLYSPRVQISRAVSLATAGVLSMVMSRTLRRAIGRADSTARERELFGKYRILRHVASGGMGTVYEALYCPEGGFERPVAIKRIHPHLAAEPTFVSFFRNEAELSARLVHPNIVQVLDFGSVDGTYFLAMELVDGLTLRSLMKRAAGAGIAIPPSIVAYIGREVLSGLAYAHGAARAADGARLKVVHRDLCPSNLLLSRNGEVKVSDFGVARALGEADSTHTRTVAGHAGYMAPEQALAQPIDERCDLFSVGVILWELLAGRSLFHRGAEGPTLVAVLSAEIAPPSALRPGLDPAWDAFITRALGRDPDVRFPSASAMSAEIGALADAKLPAADALCALVLEVMALPEPAPELITTGTRPATLESELATQVEGKGERSG
jgi:serine/threonine-protein kinase